MCDVCSEKGELRATEWKAAENRRTCTGDVSLGTELHAGHEHSVEHSSQEREHE